MRQPPCSSSPHRSTCNISSSSHGNLCFISADVAVLREMPRVCEKLETRGKNPWASLVMRTLYVAAGGKTADTLQLHTLVLDRFPLGVQADSVEFSN